MALYSKASVTLHENRDKMSCNERENQMHSMLMLPEKALLVKLYYQNRESTTAALRSYHHRNGIPTDKGPMISSVVKIDSEVRSHGLFRR